MVDFSAENQPPGNLRVYIARGLKEQIKTGPSTDSPCSAFSVSKYVICDKRQRADDPCHRVAEDDRRDRGGDLHHNCKPDDAEDADTRQSDDHGNDHITHTTERSRKDLNEDIHDIPGDDQYQHITSYPDNVSI